MQRHFFTGAPHVELDKQGRMVMPAPSCSSGAEIGREVDGRRRLRPPRDLGSREVARAATRSRRERGRCCRASCQPRLITSPSSRTRSLAALDPRPGETIVDCTFGAGGHAALLAAASARRGQADRDRPRPDASRRTSSASGASTASRRGCSTASSRPCSRSSPRTACAPTRSCSTSASRRCSSTGPSAASRTPSTRRSTCAWIRRAELSARDLVNETSERELADIFRRYGEERYARQIARAIVSAGAKQPFERTGDLVEMIKQAIPAPARFGEGHPAKRVFQALRIEVNDELGALERALPAALEMLRPHGRLGGDLVPLARGPDRQAVPARAGARLHLPARLPGLRLRRDADAARDAAAGDPAERGRGRPQPARPVGAAPRGGEGLSDGEPDARAGRRRSPTPTVRACRASPRRKARAARRAAGSSGSSSAGFCSPASYS